MEAIAALLILIGMICLGPIVTAILEVIESKKKG